MNHLPLEYFEEIYSRTNDPWGFESRWYETRKYALTLAALPSRRYRRCFELGCSIGVLSEHLAERCDSLLSVDLVPEIADIATARLKELRHVEVRAMSVPEEWPEGNFDLMVFSEVLYYFHREGLRRVFEHINASLALGGHVVVVHWRGHSDHPLSARQVHACFEQSPSFAEWATYSEKAFLLSVFEKVRP